MTVGTVWNDGRERCPVCWSDDLRAAGEDTAVCRGCGHVLRRDHRGALERIATRPKRIRNSDGFVSRRQPVLRDHTKWLCR